MTKVKEGDIAFLDNEFVEITKIVYETVARNKRIGGTLWFPKYESVDEEELKEIWWVPIGDKTGKQYTRTLAFSYNWNLACREAQRILHQAKMIIKYGT